MAQLLPHFRIRSGEQIGNDLYFQIPDLSSYPKTYLDSDASAGDTSLSANGLDFSTSQYIVVGSVGQLKTEIIQIHTATAPNKTTITLASALQFAHNRGDIVRFIPYNQLSLDTSTDNSTWTVGVTTTAIRPDATETYLQRPSDSATLYYRFRFNNSSAATFSAYSDSIQATTNLAYNSFGYIKKQALDDLGEAIGSEITQERLIQWLSEGRRELDNDQRVSRWSFRKKYNTILGQITPGTWSMNVPNDLRNPNTSENIYQIKVGLNKYPLIFQPWDIFNQNYLNMAHTTNASQITSGATSITLASTADFPIPTSGSVSVLVSAQSLTGTPLTITYTSNNVSTNTLTGVTGVSSNIAANSDFWYNINFGLPAYYTISNGVIYFDMPFMQQLGGQNVYIDYYSAMTTIYNDNSLLDETQFDLFVSWLKWKIKYRKANGNIDKDTDPDFKEWSSRKDNIINSEIADRDIRFFPG